MVGRFAALGVLACLAALPACGASSSSSSSSSSAAQSTAAPTPAPSPPCGPAGDWNAATLAKVIVPASAVPAPFTLNSSSSATADQETAVVPRVLSSALVSEGFVIGYNRDWVDGTRGAASVDLLAFKDEQGALNMEGQLTAYYGNHGVSTVPSSAIPGGTEFTITGAGGTVYGVQATRAKLLVLVLMGGPGITAARSEQLAKTQFDTLCSGGS